MARNSIDPDLQAQYEAKKAHDEIERARTANTDDFFEQKELQRIQLERDCHDTAHSIKVMYDSYIEEGFTEEQAWELVKIAVSGASQPKRTLF